MWLSIENSVSETDWVNLNYIIHIWIEKSQLGWWLQGTLVNGEDVVLSDLFESYQKCYEFALDIMDKNLN